MKIIICAVLLCLVTVAALGQSVTIVPRKTVYTRPKPIQEFKKTFTIRRPIAKASSPELSRKITAAISPESVLDLKLKDELGEYQWLEEADYKVLYNQNGVLAISSWMEGSAAYPDDVTKYAVVDLKTGKRVKVADVFTDLPALAALLKKRQAAEVKTAIAEMKKDPDNGDVHPEELFAETNFRVADLDQFSVNAKGATFYYNYGFPHVLKAVQPAGEYFVPWVKLKPFVRRGGLLARFIN